MRADRLVAILVMLQTRGHITTREVAEELEISERTARRDLEALGVAGLPIFSMQGRNGGWQLAGGGKIDLSGLTSAETRALFLVAGPSSKATPEVRAALRKLVRALPESMRGQAQAATAAMVVDSRPWGEVGSARPTPQRLDDVQRVVVDGVQTQLGYVARDQVATTRRVHPLGLASKGSRWYLIANTDDGLRTFRVDRITSVDPTSDPVVRPAGFDLQQAWSLISERVDELRAPVVARASADPSIVGHITGMLGTRVRIGPPASDGQVQLEIRGHSAFTMAAELAGWGRKLTVHEPPAVRERLRELGNELSSIYKNPSTRRSRDSGPSVR